MTFAPGRDVVARGPPGLANTLLTLPNLPLLSGFTHTKQCLAFPQVIIAVITRDRIPIRAPILTESKYLFFVSCD